MSLTSCPREILVQIFLQGDLDEIKTWSEVCRLFASIITSDVEVQYNIELMRSCMVDQPKSHSNMSIVERHRALQAFITARRNLWTSSSLTRVQFEIAKIDISGWSNDSGASWEYSSGMIAVEEDGSVRCIDILSGEILGSAETCHHSEHRRPPRGPAFDGNKILFAWVCI
ncbi:hypothetical protein BDN72DRAFT_834174 [Pluteus cervinus]|uniref:Uncharacterized protein n=1 Tax=Pluteus cervinus TaxID=181527 RepID=A0ACD3B7L7_9AGAR|nr:hypothetical protein BDN72DRAFT_834174 [Pluteus cervinus]